MRRRAILVATVVTALVGLYLLWQQPAARVEQPVVRSASASAKDQPPPERSYVARPTNALGDTLTDVQDPKFANKVFPKFREFVATLNQLGVSPFEGEPDATSCSKIRIIHIPNGFICPFVIGDGWTAEYTQHGTFEGVTHFGQRGPDNPFRAISRADTDSLSRLSQRAIAMPEAVVWPIAERVADALGIDPSRFEKPQMHAEALFEYRLGMWTVRYRAKGSDPLNQLNYTRSFTLKATSPTSAILVMYANREPR